jgi:hypothetical protein
MSAAISARAACRRKRPAGNSTSASEILCMSGLSAGARTTLHVEKPGFEPIDLKDVPAGTARMRLVLKRSPPK